VGDLLSPLQHPRQWRTVSNSLAISTHCSTWRESVGGATATVRSTNARKKGGQSPCRPNATTQYRMCREAVQIMLKQEPDANGQRGVILNMSSILEWMLTGSISRPWPTPRVKVPSSQ